MKGIVRAAIHARAEREATPLASGSNPGAPITRIPCQPRGISLFWGRLGF